MAALPFIPCDTLLLVLRSSRSPSPVTRVDPRLYPDHPPPSPRPSTHYLLPHSFQQRLLEVCGRAHSLDDVQRAVDAVQASGIPTWSLDLISGLPGLDMAAWRESLEATVAARPPHVSVYDLQVSSMRSDRIG